MGQQLGAELATRASSKHPTWDVLFFHQFLLVCSIQNVLSSCWLLVTHNIPVYTIDIYIYIYIYIYMYIYIYIYIYVSTGVYIWYSTCILQIVVYACAQQRQTTLGGWISGADVELELNAGSEAEASHSSQSITGKSIAKAMKIWKSWDLLGIFNKNVEYTSKNSGIKPIFVDGISWGHDSYQPNYKVVLQLVIWAGKCS